MNPSRLRRLKYLARINQRELPEQTDSDYEFRYLDISAVGRGLLEGRPTVMRFSEAPSRARRLVRPGDTIVSTVRTYLRAVWPVQGNTDDLVVSTGFAVISPGPEMEPRYLGWLAQSDPFIEEVVARSAGVSYPAINAAEIGELLVPVPELSRQQMVADYLDRETARIDALIAAKQQMVELLSEKRRSLIAHFVTRGLDANVPTRDSGIAWLGQIPAHWEIRRLKRIGRSIIGLTFDPADTTADGQGVIVLRASNVKDQEINLDDKLHVRTEVPALLRTRLNDILICARSGSRDLIGKNALINEAAAGLTFGAFMTVFRSRYNGFIFYVLNSPLFDYQAGAFSTSTINQLTSETLNAMAVPFPPESEQLEIVAFLRERCVELDSSQIAIRRSIGLLQERRHGLITAAVTGQLEILEAA